MKKKLKNFGVFSLMVGVSTFAMMYTAAKQGVPELTKAHVIIDNKSMSLCDFCGKIDFVDSTWVYTGENGKKIKVDMEKLHLFDDKGGQKLKDKLNEKNIEKMVLEAKFSKIFHMER